MNEFEYKTYLMKEKPFDLVKALWVYPYEDEKWTTLIVFYKHKGNIHVEEIITNYVDSPLESYEEITTKINEDIINQIRINEERLYSKVQNSMQSEYITQELDSDFYMYLKLLNYIGYFKKRNEYALKKYNSLSKESYKVKVGEFGINIYNKLLKECKINLTDLEEYIMQMPFKAPKGLMHESF